MEESRMKGPNEKFCPSCGRIVDINTEICPYCGVRIMAPPRDYDAIDRHRTWIVTLLLCIFLGGIGAHRFYVGKVGTGVLMLLTAGGFGIWWLIDLIMIIVGSFTDKDGYQVR